MTEIKALYVEWCELNDHPQTPDTMLQFIADMGLLRQNMANNIAIMEQHRNNMANGLKRTQSVKLVSENLRISEAKVWNVLSNYSYYSLLVEGKR